MVQYEGAPGRQQVGEDQQNVEQNRQQEIPLGILDIKVRRSEVDIQDVHTGTDGGYLGQVGGGVREDDEVDDEEGGVEDQVGAADEDGAGPDTELNTAHHSTHLNTSQHISTLDKHYNTGSCY